MARNGGRPGARAAGPGGDPGRRGPVGAAGPVESVTTAGTVTGPDRDSDLGTEDRALAPLTRDSID